VLDEQRRIISDARALNPAAVAAAAGARKRRSWLGPSGRMMIIAADHSARGVLAVGDRPMAMANRTDMLDRILVALGRPGVDEMERVAEASTLPSLLLGGDVGDKPDEMFDRWQSALSLPGVRGLVAGRNLLYPPDDDVAAAVDIAVSLL
jgi:hypothetical protein